MKKRNTVEMCEGSILGNMLLYALPLIATGLLQLIYNAADIIVVAKWAGGTAFAAVGSNGSLTGLIVNFSIGISIGASVIISRYYGARDYKNLHDAVHTAMVLGAICGVITMTLGLAVSRYALELMNTPADVIDQATLYLRIYFLGMPAQLIYNFGAAILRSVGDTKRPMYILTVTGLVNILLNMVLVILFHLDVAGVGIATVVSQVLSAVAVVWLFVRSTDAYKLSLRELRLHPDKVRAIIRYGVPAGINSTVFSISNITIQSSVNSLGSAVMSGNAAALNLEGLTFTAMNSMHQTCLAFTSQNIGAGKPERLGKIIGTGLALVTAIGLIFGWGIYLFGEQLLTLYTATSATATTISAEEIIKYGMIRLSIISTSYFVCGIQDVLTGTLRGMGSPWMPMIVSIIGICGVRITWVYTVFLVYHTQESLYISYIVSWVVTAVIETVMVMVQKRKIKIQLSPTPAAQVGTN